MPSALASEFAATSEFQAFVRSRFEQIAESANQNPSQQLGANPEEWKLSKLPDPLQLQDIGAAVAVDADAEFREGRV